MQPGYLILLFSLLILKFCTDKTTIIIIIVATIFLLSNQNNTEGLCPDPTDNSCWPDDEQPPPPYTTEEEVNLFDPPKVGGVVKFSKNPVRNCYYEAADNSGPKKFDFYEYPDSNWESGNNNAGFLSLFGGFKVDRVQDGSGQLKERKSIAKCQGNKSDGTSCNTPEFQSTLTPENCPSEEGCTFAAESWETVDGDVKLADIIMPINVHHKTFLNDAEMRTDFDTSGFKRILHVHDEDSKIIFDKSDGEKEDSAIINPNRNFVSSKVNKLLFKDVKYLKEKNNEIYVQCYPRSLN